MPDSEYDDFDPAQPRGIDFEKLEMAIVEMIEVFQTMRDTLRAMPAEGITPEAFETTKGVCIQHFNGLIPVHQKILQMVSELGKLTRGGSS